MDDETRKMMTEWLGGYNWEDYDYETADDMMHCKNRLVELGLWNGFLFFSQRRWLEVTSDDSDEDLCLINWLLYPARFCQLAADFLKEREGK